MGRSLTSPHTMVSCSFDAELVQHNRSVGLVRPRPSDLGAARGAEREGDEVGHVHRPRLHLEELIGVDAVHRVCGVDARDDHHELERVRLEKAGGDEKLESAKLLREDGVLTHPHLILRGRVRVGQRRKEIRGAVQELHLADAVHRERDGAKGLPLPVISWPAAARRPLVGVEHLAGGSGGRWIGAGRASSCSHGARACRSPAGIEPRATRSDDDRRRHHLLENRLQIVGVRRRRATRRPRRGSGSRVAGEGDLDLETYHAACSSAGRRAVGVVLATG